MQFWKKKETTPFTDIKRIAQSLPSSSPDAAVQKLIIIFNKVFISVQNSLFSTIYEDAFRPISNDNNSSWKKSLIEAVQLFSPESSIGRALLMNRDVRIELESLNNSSQLQNYLKKSELKKSQNSQSFDYSVQLPIFECFFIHLSIWNANTKPQTRRFQQWQEIFFEDDFYYHIVRNPFLLIMKQWLQFSTIDSHLYDRLQKIYEIVFLKDYTNFLKKNQTALIKNTVIHAVYMISEMRINVHVWQFLQTVNQNMKKRNNPAILSAWVRLNLSILMAQTQYEIKSKLALNDFNLRRSEMQRPYFKSRELLKNDDYQEIDKSKLSGFLRKLEDLIELNNWQNTADFIQSIYILICISSQIMPQKTNSKIGFMKRIFKMGLNKQNTFFNELRQYYQSKLLVAPRNFFDQDQAEFYRDSSQDRRQSWEIEEIPRRRSLITHQGDLSTLNIWLKPLQPNESQILLEISKSFAFCLDKIRHKPPKLQKVGERQLILPYSDVRWMASWKLYLTIICILFLMKWLS